MPITFAKAVLKAFSDSYPTAGAMFASVSLPVTSALRAASIDAPVTALPLAAVAEAWAGPADIRYILSPVRHAHDHQ